MNDVLQKQGVFGLWSCGILDTKPNFVIQHESKG